MNLDRSEPMINVDEESRPEVDEMLLQEQNPAAALQACRRELIAAKQHLKEVERMRDELLSVCSHDLKSPIASILSFLELIRDDKARLSRKQFEDILFRMERAGRLCLQLVEDILDKTRIDQGKAEVNAKALLWSVLVAEGMQMMQSQLDKRRQKVDFQISGSEQKVKVDPRMALQIFNNLISNAVKFSPEAGTIYVRVSESEKHVTLSIRDEGSGIPEEEQKLLFQEFQQLSTKSATGEKGTGLGLSIVKKLVELNKGKVEVQSKPGEGACFNIRLPVAENPMLVELFRSKR